MPRTSRITRAAGRRIAVLIAATQATSLSAKTPVDIRNPRQTITMDYLMESCTVVGETAGGLVNYFDCESYLYGLIDAQAELNAKLPAAERVCVPESIAPWQVYGALSGIESRDDGSRPAAPIVLAFLHQQYPCR